LAEKMKTNMHVRNNLVTTQNNPHIPSVIRTGIDKLFPPTDPLLVFQNSNNRLWSLWERKNKLGREPPVLTFRFFRENHQFYKVLLGDNWNRQFFRNWKNLATLI
jgi:hypothetical protein